MRCDLLLDLAQAPRVRGRPCERQRVPVGREREVPQPPLERLALDRAAFEVLLEPVRETALADGRVARRVLAEDPLPLAAVH